MTNDDFASLDAIAQAELVRRREVQPVDLLEASISRIEHLNPRLNAIVTHLYDQARLAVTQEIPNGPFTGVPFTPVCNVTGQPAMSVTLYWNKENLPVDVHFIGRYCDEATLFRLAAQLATARSWIDKKPPVSVFNPESA